MSLEILKDVTPFKLNLNKSDSTNHQVIYASQLYGTFFAVSAKLEFNGSLLKSMKLTLVNYKGLYNLGLLDATRTSFELDGGKAKLTLHLSAFYGVHGNGKELTVDCEDADLTNIVEMDVNRQLHSFYQSGDPLTQHLFNHCLDSEFYERDGAAISPRERMDTKIEEIVHDDPHMETAASGVCKITSLILL
ncbi:hypothetical protein [Croceivirga thetidis]|uniref:Uncharacterized protein n=1 Tax=Croceivirga thetidis TaxID=2721623 RepID=A0ABX1GU26_9FLAO|nr:hypothetical protein [Croceivirga thetidis]NKI33153.1 hypothetical protein [Croceivirga thetidis]